MLELADRILPALRRGEPVAAVTVSRVSRSAPRPAGAAMAVLCDGSVVGSISGGCVEGDAVLLATGVLRRGGIVRAALGFSDDAAHAAGLACGGAVDVVIHRIEPDDEVALAALERAAAGRNAALSLALDGAGRAEPADLDSTTGVDQNLLTICHRPPAQLVIVGAGEHAGALARVATAAGMRVSVCDVWERLVTPERFPTVERLAIGDPSAVLADLIDDPVTSAVCVLTHDERLDVPAIATALALGVGFVGAMGARSTVEHRRRLLLAAGVSAADIDLVHAPLGLDLGGASPEETAVSVLAEIVAARHGGTGRALRDTTGALHPRGAAVAPSAAGARRDMRETSAC